MSSTEDEELSIRLSTRMQRAGFRAANARVQAAMASALQDIVHFLLKINIHVFGSFADGWGSCLTRLDGRVGDDSDIDVTVITKGQPLHLDDVAPGASRCEPSHEYKDGHVSCPATAPGPNLHIKKFDLPPTMPDIDLIAAVPCSRYPHIQLLQPGYKSRTGRKSHISSHILQALSQELQSPRCHAVAASPPGLDGKWMRVSTTLLERLVMHHLTTVQGQFFILVNFLIKKVIIKKVNGLKTYMAKNLLFYMLDETPAEDWQPQNLVPLVRQSLQILVAMMESSASDHVCMTHFFLRDANVYLKKDHRTKEMIMNVINETSKQLPSLLSKFAESLAESEVTVVHFHMFLSLVFIAEFLESESKAIELRAYELVRDAHCAVSKKFSGMSAEQHLEKLLLQIDDIPDCFSISRECLRVMAHLKVGKQLDDAALEFAVSRGIQCPADDNVDNLLSVDEARAIVLSALQEVRPMKLRVDNGTICGFMLEQELLGIASLLIPTPGGHFPDENQLYRTVVDIPPLQRFLQSQDNNIDGQVRRVMRDISNFFWNVVLERIAAAFTEMLQDVGPPGDFVEDDVE